MSVTTDPHLSGRDRHAKRRRIITTPEGVELPIRIAQAGERFFAFLVDLAIMGLTILVVTVFIVLFGRDFIGIGWAASAALLVFFAVRSFYFIFFELRWQGRTPGKKLLGLRVVDRRGGPLRADAVVARNLMREVEVFIPMSLLFIGGFRGVDGLGQLFAWGWVIILLLMPLFNRDRLRVGDVVGGTMVIAAPKAALMPDLVRGEDRGSVPAVGTGAPTSPVEAGRGPAFRFSEAQLDVYGIYELQVLEKVLRSSSQADGEREVALRIQRKIAWQDEVTDPRAFLEAFYTALRARLEHRMLFGQRRESKHDPGGPSPA